MPSIKKKPSALQARLTKLRRSVETGRQALAAKEAELERLEKLSSNEFALFANLPPELRSKIWSFAVVAEQPRLVHVLDLREQSSCSTMGSRSPTKLPALLSTCCEARAEALKVYPTVYNQGAVCFAPTRDILMISCFGTMGLISRRLLDCHRLSIRTIAISVPKHSSSFTPADLRKVRAFCLFFPSLDHIVFTRRSSLRQLCKDTLVHGNFWYDGPSGYGEKLFGAQAEAWVKGCESGLPQLEGDRVLTFSMKMHFTRKR